MTLDIRYRITPAAGHTAPRNELNTAQTIAGTNTITLVDRGGGDYVWQFSGAGLASGPMDAVSRNPANSGEGWWIAVTLKMVTYPTTSFTPLLGIGNTTDLAADGHHLSQNTSSSLRARVKGVSLSATLSTVGTTEYTFAMRVRMNASGGSEIQEIWRTTSGRVGTDPDVASSVGVLTTVNMGTVVFNTLSASGTNATYQIKDLVFGVGEPTNTEMAGLADNLRVAIAPPTATAITLSGPASGASGAASTNFTVGVSPTGGAITGTVVVTPSDGGNGGSFTPTTVSLTTAAPTATFTYTPASSGTKTISVTNNGGLTNPANLSYSSSSAAATAITLSGPGTSTVGSPSASYTLDANGSITGTITITPNDGGAGGSFSPATSSISNTTPTASFTYTASSAGAKTISVTNNGGLTNPASVTTTASLAAATALSASGPSGGLTGVVSGDFTVTANGTITGTVVVTPSDGGGGGTFNPSTVSLSSGSPSTNFTYTPGSAGAKTISFTNNGSLTNPSSRTYTASDVSSYINFGLEKCDHVQNGLLPNMGLTAVVFRRDDLSVAKQVVTGITTTATGQVPPFQVTFAVGTPVHVVLISAADNTATGIVSDHSTEA